MAETGTIYTPGWREAIEIKHFVQECKHVDPPMTRTRDPSIKGPTPDHFGHHTVLHLHLTCGDHAEALVI